MRSGTVHGSASDAVCRRCPHGDRPHRRAPVRGGDQCLPRPAAPDQGDARRRTSTLIKELAVACEGAVVLFDAQVRVTDTYPDDLAPDMLDSVGALVTHEADTAVSSATQTDHGVIITQSIRVGRTLHGHLAVIRDRAPHPTHQVLIGHANSLLALDFEKPRRLHGQQNQINGEAVRILLSHPADLAHARDIVAGAADRNQMIRVLTVLFRASSSDTAREIVAAAVDGQLLAAARPVFMITEHDALMILLRGGDTAEFAERLFEALPTAHRGDLRLGLSRAHSVDALQAAVEESRTAAASARGGGPPEESNALAGRALLSAPESRQVIDHLARILIDPLIAHDAEHGSDLLGALRAYLEANGQWEAAASALHVHRHTLRGRVTRAEEILGCDLSVARVRAEVLLAIIVRS
ncbi:hypothetical protein FOB84_02875 [Gordonia bronchialis]|nr:hypothetical protein FOB84_02875 [Gordonia bronchialis]